MDPARRRLLEGAGASVSVFVLFGVVTGLIPNDFYVRMVPRTALDYAFLVATAVFAGAFVAQRDRLGEEASDELATGGVVGG